MTRMLRTAALCCLPLFVMAQEETREAKPFFIEVGANKIDSGADAFTIVAQAGIPIYRRGLTYVGIFGGGTQWKRGPYSSTSVMPGDLLDKSAYWGGVYWGGQFTTLGVGPEYAKKETYMVPQYTNDWYDDVTKKQFGAQAFLSFHWKNGLGAFVRAGTQSGVGAGLSLNFWCN